MNKLTETDRRTDRQTVGLTGWLLTGGVERDNERVWSELVAGKTLVSAVVFTGRIIDVQYGLVPYHRQLHRGYDVVATAVRRHPGHC